MKGRGAAEDSNAFTRSETSRQTEDTTADGSYLQNLWYNTTIESQENAKDGMLDLVDAKFHQLA